MDCGQMAVIRQSGCWSPRAALIRAGLIRVGLIRVGLICGTCILPGMGALPGMGLSPGQAVAGTLTAVATDQALPMTGLDQRLSPQGRVLAAMRALIQDDRAAEAYQLGQIAVMMDRGSPVTVLALAYAALKSGRCQLAMRHLARLSDDDLTPPLRQRRDMIRADCIGPWQREATISLTAGYRRSLVDRARLVSMRFAPGSALHGLCTRLRGLCDPDAAFQLEGQRASGIDIWTQLSLGHHHRDGGSWAFAITPSIFFRTPRRAGYCGEGASLRLDAWRDLVGSRRLHLFAERGAARFQQGDPANSIAQKHRQLGIGFVMPHGSMLASYFGHRRHRATSRWLDLRQRVTSYRLMADRGGILSGWAGLAVEKSSQGGPGLMPGARVREREAGMGLRLQWMQIGLHHLRRVERFSDALPYLAAPHRAVTRQTGITLMPDIHWSKNLKVVVSLTDRRILSPGPYRPKKTKNAFITINYKFQPDHFPGL